MTANATSLPNPFTPFAFLPPASAGQAQASAYLSVGVLAASLWDWLLSISDEIYMCRKRKFRTAIVVYFLSRISTLAYCVLVVIFQVVPLAHCQTVSLVLGGILVLVVPSTSALFFLRVRAVYNNNKIITASFGVLWLSLCGLCFLIPQSTSSTHLGTTQMCIITRMAPYVSIPILVHAAFDTLVFLAISFRMVSFSIVGDTFSARMKSFFRGDGLPSLPRSLLVGGQAYYVASISLNIVLVIMVLAPVPRAYQAMFVVPHVALDSAMACRVFRGIKLGNVSDNDAVGPTATPLRFAQITTTAMGSSTKHNEGKADDLNHPHRDIVVDLRKETESA